MWGAGVVCKPRGGARGAVPCRRRGAQGGQGAGWAEGPAATGRCPPALGRGRSVTLLLRVRLPERGLAGLSVNGRLTSHPDAVRRVPGAAGAAALLVFLNFNHAWISGRARGLNYLQRWQFPLCMHFHVGVLFAPLVSALLVLASLVR